MCLRRTLSGWRRCDQIFAEDISSTLLIFNTSLHLHQIALRPECSKQMTSPNLPFCPLSSLPYPVLFPPSHCLSLVADTQGSLSTWTIAFRLYPSVDINPFPCVQPSVNVEVNKPIKQEGRCSARKAPKSSLISITANNNVIILT